MKALAVDPGLDRIAGVVFDWPDRPRDMTSALRGMVEVEFCETDPDQEIHKRLAKLVVWVWNCIAEHDVTVVIVEAPAKMGAYARHGKAQRANTDRYFMAFGALLAGVQLSVAECIQRPADSTSKDMRLSLLQTAAKTAKVQLPEGPRGGARQDEIDAIWTGCAWAATAPYSLW